MHEELLVSLGKKKAQLVLKKVKYLNVFSKTIQVADIAIHNGTIVGVGEDYCGEKEIYFKNKILVPALIDSHIHICSTLVTPRNFMNVAAQHGVVTIINDPHEITNVLGEKGLNFFLADAKTAVGNVYFSLPSCVPVSKFDMSNAVFDANNMKKYINLPEVVSLGEMMNVFGTINYDSVI
jgi:adenine deaminase